MQYWQPPQCPRIVSRETIFTFFSHLDPVPPAKWQCVAIDMPPPLRHTVGCRHTPAAPLSVLTRFHVKVTFYRFRVSSLITHRSFCLTPCVSFLEGARA